MLKNKEFELQNLLETAEIYQALNEEENSSNSKGSKNIAEKLKNFLDKIIKKFRKIALAIKNFITKIFKAITGLDKKEKQARKKLFAEVRRKATMEKNEWDRMTISQLIKKKNEISKKARKCAFDNDWAFEVNVEERKHIPIFNFYLSMCEKASELHDVSINLSSIDKFKDLNKKFEKEVEVPMEVSKFKKRPINDTVDFEKLKKYLDTDVNAAVKKCNKEYQKIMQTIKDCEKRKSEIKKEMNPKDREEMRLLTKKLSFSNRCVKYWSMPKEAIEGHAQFKKSMLGYEVNRENMAIYNKQIKELLEKIEKLQKRKEDRKERYERYANGEY